MSGVWYERSIVDRNGNTIEFEYEHCNPLDGRACPVEFVVPSLCELPVRRVVDAAGLDGSAPRETRTIDIAYYPAAGVITTTRPQRSTGSPVTA